MRRGSALLIVLGMVSFMVVSAVGFSIYMRQSRVPSSHLRREATSRYLLKSALANAIARIEGAYNSEVGRFEGIYDDVYPGVSFSGLPDSENGNIWNHRVFSPFGPVDAKSTVSTLTLEGLAYLPPAIINEVRVFSRMTRTAKWSNLAYDLGRYAFCAVDVSDCFDINKVYATGRRTSAAGERVNLSSLYPNGGSSLDSLFDRAGDIPYVSVADFNIAAGRTAYTPFVGYVGSSGSRIYGSGDAATVSNALFITDTWFPETNDYLTARLERKSRVESDIYNIASQNDQPFRSFEANSFMEPLLGGTRFLTDVLIKNLGTVGVACLYDYLDEDSVPISLCLPCVETVPMVCGLGLYPADELALGVDTSVKLQGTHDTGQPNAAGTGTIQENVVATRYGIKIPDMSIPVKMLLSFPFKRTQFRQQKPTGYTAKALVRLFFAPRAMNCRLNADSPILPKANWNSGLSAGILSVPCDITCTISPVAKPTTSDTLFECVGMATVPGQTLPLFWKVDRTPQEPAGAPTTSYYSCDGLKNLAPAIYRENGLADEGWKNTLAAAADEMPDVSGGVWANLPGVANNNIDADLNALELIPHLAVWMRIEKGGETVDLVPACPEDDVIWGKRGSEAKEAGEELCKRASPPMLDFRGSDAKAFKIGLAGLTGKLDGQPDQLRWNQLLAVDPRYNYAPEDWFAVAGTGALRDSWQQSVVEGFLNRDGRDKDVFMFTSDQEYLQSVGELQFLPFVQETNGRAGGFNGTFRDRTGYNGADMANRLLLAGGAADSLPFGSKELLWRTYRAYDRGTAWPQGWCNPYEMRTAAGKIATVISGTGDFRVNPFTRDARVLAAAVKDTPYDYYVASTNEARNGLSASASARDKAFGEGGACEQWDAIDVEDIVGRLRDAFLEAARDGLRDHTEAMYDLDWEDANAGDAQKRIFNLPDDLADPLHGVDRKFLFSFWRECFQNRQQLFLVFLRAEPLTVGGSTGDALANSQLGARGVALVWRDPEPPTRNASQRKGRSALSGFSNLREQYRNCPPHRTRILFYHQFD